MNTKKTATIWPLLLIFTTALSACGIDRGGIVDPVFIPDPLASQFPGAVVIGTIDAVNGSQISVNTSTVDLSATVVTTNGVVTNSSALVAGQYIVATSLPSREAGAWDQLTLDFNVAGDAILINPLDSSFELHGQVIDISNLDAANIEGGSLPTNAPASIAVSGYTRADGVIDARAVINYPDTAPALVSGFARQLDPVNFTFLIGAQAYDYAQAQSINTPDGMINDHDRLRITINPQINNGVYTVISIDAIPQIDSALQPGADISVTGYVNSVTGQNAFALFYQQVTVDASTVFENLPTTTVQIDQLVLVRGDIQADGSVLATLVRLLN